MVVLTLRQLILLREKMTDHCLGSHTDIVIDGNQRAVYLQWKYWREVEGKIFDMSQKVTFEDIAYGKTDALALAAEKGSKDFAEGVTKMLEGVK